LFSKAGFHQAWHSRSNLLTKLQTFLWRWSAWFLLFKKAVTATRRGM
jgi:hypothetical protein